MNAQDYYFLQILNNIIIQNTRRVLIDMIDAEGGTLLTLPPAKQHDIVQRVLHLIVKK